MASTINAAQVSDELEGPAPEQAPTTANETACEPPIASGQQRARRMHVITPQPCFVEKLMDRLFEKLRCSIISAATKSLSRAFWRFM